MAVVTVEFFTVKPTMTASTVQHTATSYLTYGLLGAAIIILLMIVIVGTYLVCHQWRMMKGRWKDDRQDLPPSDLYDFHDGQVQQANRGGDAYPAVDSPMQDRAYIQYCNNNEKLATDGSEFEGFQNQMFTMRDSQRETRSRTEQLMEHEPRVGFAEDMEKKRAETYVEMLNQQGASSRVHSKSMPDEQFIEMQKMQIENRHHPRNVYHQSPDPKYAASYDQLEASRRHEVHYKNRELMAVAGAEFDGFVNENYRHDYSRLSKNNHRNDHPQEAGKTRSPARGIIFTDKRDPVEHGQHSPALPRSRADKKHDPTPSGLYYNDSHIAHNGDAYTGFVNKSFMLPDNRQSEQYGSKYKAQTKSKTGKNVRSSRKSEQQSLYPNLSESGVASSSSLCPPSPPPPPPPPPPLPTKQQQPITQRKRSTTTITETKTRVPSTRPRSATSCGVGQINGQGVTLVDELSSTLERRFKSMVRSEQEAM